ncbi:MAG TPA: AMP-binding protein [Vicinamibacterales bacterium]
MPTATRPIDASLVLDVVRDLVAELNPERLRRTIGLDDSLTRELALGSLERVELLLRLEQATGVRLDEATLGDADSPRQLLAALMAHAASPGIDDDLLAIAPAPTGRGPGRGASTAARTLVDVLRWHADATPDRVHIHLREDDGRERSITYAGLWRDAAAVAAGLTARRVAPGDRVALLLRTEVAFFQAFFGVLLAGAVPVPLYPPFRADGLEEYARRQSGILRNAGARLLLTFAEAERVARLLRPLAPSLSEVTTVEGIGHEVPALAVPNVDAGDLAVIQYTSGSTGMPKGVALSHANLLANIRAFGEAFDINADDVGVTWLPLYHDMGLIGTWLGALYYGIPLVAMSPLAFLSRPARWLQAFQTHRGTLTAAPNFAYDLCVRKISDEEIDRLDLSSWRCALNGAEAIAASTIDRFCDRFSRCGFRREAMKPVYGLAEASLCVTAPLPGREPRTDRLAREPFERGRRIVPATAADRTPLTFVGCGRPLRGHDVRIVSAGGGVLGERSEGSIHFRGPSVMQGYFQNPDATSEVARGDGWFDSGDLGYWADGDLFITGRVKDVIIAAGRNIHPQEVEEAAGDVAGVRRGCVAAFGVDDPRTGTERLVVVAEARDRSTSARSALSVAIVARVTDAIGVPPDQVVIAPPGAIPKSSSGKIRRSATKQLFTSGTLGRGRTRAAWQFIRLSIGAIVWRLTSALRWLGPLALTAWVMVCLLVMIPLTWLAVRFAGNPTSARRRIRTTCRVLLRAGGFTPHVQMTTPNAFDGAAVIVANHASYLDVVLLLATLPVTVRFAAKAKLTTYPVLGTLIRRAGSVEVQRGATAVADDLAATLRNGESLFVFPEGTFVRASGVMPFRLGAFHTAVDTGTPILPIAICGTRAVLPDGRWLLTRGPLELRVGNPLRPERQGWSEIVRLRDLARTWIAKECGEPAVDRSSIIVDGAIRSN